MKEIGKKLKEARNKKSYSIPDVSVAIKINIKTLQAIEEGDLSRLPSKPFLRGFVQTYAKYLELDVDEIMNEFANEVGTTKPPIQTENSSESVTGSIEETNNQQVKMELMKKGGYLLAACVAIFLVYFIHKTVKKYEAEQRIAADQKTQIEQQDPSTEATTSELISSEADSLENSETQEPKAEELVSSNTSKPAQETLPASNPVSQNLSTQTNAQTPPPPVPAKPQATPPTTLVAPVAQVTPKPPTPAAPTTPVAATPAPPTPAVTPTAVPAETVKKGSPQRIIIEALDNVEVKYIKDDGTEKTVKLKPEQILTIQAESKVNLNINDGGAVSIIRNGRDVGVPGTLGKSIKLNYPR